MPKLRDVCPRVRSKVAGPFWVTIDLFFDSREAFDAELARVMPRVQSHLLRIQFRAQVARYDELRHQDYGVITGAVLAGDEQKARAVTQRHFRRMIDVMHESQPQA